MSDQFQETTYKGWGTRLKESLGGIVIGLILLIAMPILLFWNEGRAVQTAKSLKEGASAVREVSSDRVASENAGQLLHIAGDLKVETPLVDPVTGISVVAVSLQREAEMYQWVETCSSRSEKKLGGGEETVTTCNYAREWKSGRIESADFRKPEGHSNPAPTVQSGTVTQTSAPLGAFTMDERILGRLSGGDPVAITDAMMTEVRSKVPGGANAELQGNTIYLRNSTAPQVGDMRLVMTSAAAGQMSVIGQQIDVQGTTQLAPYQTEAGDQLLLVSRGIVAAKAMFKEAEQANTIITWLLRVVGLVFLFAAFAAIMSVLGVLADVVPIAGTLVRYGTSTIALILALLVGGTVIGVAWIWYRPLVGLGVMAAAAAISFVLWRRGAQSASAAENSSAVS